jgi:hypothetical protein
MCQVKELFFLPSECVMQLHVPAHEHVNNHPHCLHLWRPLASEIPRPPSVFVGVAEAGVLAGPREAMELRRMVEAKLA